MSATEATIWFIATTLMILLVVGGGIMLAINNGHFPHRHHH